jgi:formylglycine-generating enzyme required for sulfatase activity
VKKLARILAFVALVVAVAAVAVIFVALRGWRRIEPPSAIAMVSIPATMFEMGRELPDSQSSDQVSPHRVELSAFSIDVHETTVGQYLNCARAGRCRWRKGILAWPLEAPMGGVTWHDARNYCRFAGKVLPTEAQWELAARGVDGREYPWGDTWQPELANACDGEGCAGEIDGYAGHAPPGSFPDGVSPYGVFDMAGNMLEWVDDWYDRDYYRHSALRDPRGPENGEVKVVRGGSYRPATMGSPERLKTWYRTTDPPDVNPEHIGFRCARQN